MKQGQTLVVLDQSALKLQVDQRSRAKAPGRHSATPRRTVRKLTSRQPELDSNQAKAAVDLAKVQLGYATVPAPHSGVVVTVTTNAGQNAGPGRTLLTLSDPGSLFVRVFVPEAQIGSVKVGQQVTVTPDSPGEPYTGTVSFVASEAEFHAQQRGDQRPANQARVRGPSTDQ